MSSTALELPKGSLAELTDHLQALFDTLEMIDDPEVKREAEAEMQRYLEAEVRKVDNISFYIATCERQAEGLKQEVTRLRERAAMYEARSERIRDYVKRVMQQSGSMKLEGKTATFYLRAATPSVLISDESLLPEEFVKVTVTRVPDRRAIKEAIEAGHDVPGADLTLGGQTLVRR